jgi:Mce-associated membrane protein
MERTQTVSANVEELPVVDETPVGPEDSGPGVARRALGWLGNPRALVLVAVLLVLAGGWFQWRAAAARTDPAVTNQALVDTAGSTRVVGDVSDELNKIFSYAYDNTAVTAQAAQQSLTGAAASQYNTLFAQVRAHAGAQKLTLTTRTVYAGVTRLSNGTAQLLVFLDQSAVRGDTGAHSTSAAELAVTAQLSDNHWQITTLQSR